MADITMDLNDTLELDAVIEGWDDPNSIVDVSDKQSLNISGFQTKTRVIDPQDSGEYTITVNGQDLDLKVTNPDNIPNKVVDNFEDGNINSYSNNTGAFSVVENKVYEGTFSLYNSRSNSATITAGVDSGLPRVPERGDKFRFSFYIGSNDEDVRFGWAGPNYHVFKRSTDWSGNGGDFELYGPDYKLIDSVENSNYSTPVDTWAIIEVDFTDPISVELYDSTEYPEGTKITSLSATNNEYDSGDIEWYANSGNSSSDGCWYDALYLS